MPQWQKNDQTVSAKKNRWTVHSAQRQRSGCNNIPSFLQQTACSLYEVCTWHDLHILVTILLRLENPSSVWAKLCTVATSNNREHAPQSLNYCLIAPYVCGVVLRAHAVHGDSGVQVRIWKFCNPDPILNFFINSIFKPYPKSKHYGLRYPI